MKAITLIQPWATLIAIGEKRNETRSWYTSLRGELCIHAGKKVDETAFEEFREVLQAHGYREPGQLPTGCIVAVGNVQYCTYIDSHYIRELSAKERSYGDYREGRYAWRLKETKALARPVPVRGAQGLWYVPAGVEQEIRRRLEAMGGGPA